MALSAPREHGRMELSSKFELLSKLNEFSVSVTEDMEICDSYMTM